MIRQIQENELTQWHDILEIAYFDAYENQERGRSIAYEDLLTEYKSGHMFFLIELKNKIIGVLRLMKRDDFYIIKDIAIHPDYQQKGYGKDLIEFAKTKAKELGANKVELGFFDDNASLRNWYEKHGFISVKTFSFNGSPDPNQIIRIMACFL